MPPKKGSQQPSKKNVEKQKQKIIEDKTFGIKNKKGAKQQKYVEQVEKQVTFGNKSAREIEKAKLDKLDKKNKKTNEIDELRELFKPVINQKIDKDADPKSILCAYYKQGLCKKGAKCKFSHDLAIERKTAKRNMYEKENNDMTNWDQDKLEEVIDKRHGLKNKGLPPTSIICKFFIDAVESSKYGWFWECPNGPTCHYRHALPPDYVLKKDQKKMNEQKENEISIEELIEKERASLGPNQTPVTWDTFRAWKKRKRSEKIKADADVKAEKEKEFKQGKQTGLSGRELFDFNPEFIKENQDDDLQDGDTTIYMPTSSADNAGGSDGEDNDEYLGPIHDIKLSDFDNMEENDENMKGDTKLTGNEFEGACAIDEDLFNPEELDDLDEELENS